MFVAMLWLSCKDGSLPELPVPTVLGMPTWPEAPTTVFSSPNSLEPVVSGDGTAAVWIERQNPTPVADWGPLYRLDTFTGKLDILTEEALAFELLISENGDTVVFVRGFDDPRLGQTLHVAMDGEIRDLGAWMPDSPLQLDASGSLLLYFDPDYTLHLWRPEGEEILPAGAQPVDAGPGQVAWCDSEGLHLGLDRQYAEVSCQGSIVASPSGAVVWADGDAVRTQWPGAEAPVAVLSASEYHDIEYPRLFLSEDGGRLAIIADTFDEQSVLWTWTRGEDHATRVTSGVDSYSQQIEGDTWLFTRGSELIRVRQGEASVLQPDVCDWRHGYGRVAFTAGDCTGVVEARLMGVADEAPSPPFEARSGTLALVAAGVIVVDGEPGEPGTAWLFDGHSDPVRIVDDVDGILAADWGWIGVRGEFSVGEVSLFADGWATAPGNLTALDESRWHLWATYRRNDAFDIDVVLLAR